MGMQKGFSIREYASRMRSVNLVNCWPFDETAGEETVKSLLPPITVQKFTWWLDQLHSESTNEVVDMPENKKKRKKKVLEKEAVKVKSLMDKTKAPKKKRSIVEIFAVAPPVERAFSEDEEEDSVQEDTSFISSHCSQAEIRWGPKGKRNEKKKKNTDAIKKKKKKKMGLSVPNKENSLKSKLQADKAIGDQSSSYSKDVENYIHPSVSILKRKLKLQNEDAYDKTNYSECSKSTISNEAAVPNKHVTFSDKNDRRSGKQSSNYSECSNKLLRKDSPVAKTSGIEDVSMGIDKEVDAGFASKEDYEEECISRSEASDKSTSLSMNKNLSESRFGEVTRDSLYACTDTGCFSMSYCNSPNYINVTTKSSSSNYRRLKKDLVNLDPIFPPMCFKSNNEASVLSHQSNMERVETVPRANFSQSTAVNSSFQSQTFPCHSSDELLHPFTGNIRAKTSINGLLSEDFVGLPLNSQGELISLNPCAKMDFNQKMKSSADRFSERRRLDRLNLFPVDSYVIKQNPLLIVPSRFDITESQSGNQTNLGLDFLTINEHAFHDSDNMVQKNPRNEKIHSTMRLMGKEFTIGGRGFQGFEDGLIWKDKRIVKEPRFGNNSVSNITVQDQKFRETLFCPSENMHTGVFAGIKLDRLQKVYPSSEFHNRESILPTSTADHQESMSQFLFRSAIQPKNQQNLPQSPISSAIRFPFIHPDMDGHTKSYCSQKPSLNYPSSCVDVSPNGTRLGRNSLFSPLPPRYPGILPAVSSVPKRHGNQKKIEEPIKSRIGNKFDIPFNPINMPTFGFRDVRSSARFDASFQNIGRSFESCEYEDERIISHGNDNAELGPI